MSEKHGNLTIWLNVYYTPDESGPNYRGKVDIDGESYELSLWINSHIHDIPIHMSGQVTRKN